MLNGGEGNDLIFGDSVRLLAPAPVKVSEHWPAATVPVHDTVPSLTVTLPAGVPLPEVTLYCTVTDWPTTGPGLHRATRIRAEAEQAMTTARKLWLGFGALTAVLALFVALMLVRLQSIQRHVQIQVEVARPRSEATRELELNVLGFALNLHAHIAGSPGRKSESRKAAAEVERHRAEYEALAETARQRELATQFAARWRDLEALGATLMDADLCGFEKTFSGPGLSASILFQSDFDPR